VSRRPRLPLLRARLRWTFIQAWEFWVALASIAGAVAAWWFGNELQLRSYGFAMQVLGALTAAHAVLSNERLFGLPRFKERFRGWIKRFPRRHAVAATANITAGAIVMSGRATSRHPKRAEDALEVQVERLWLNFSALDNELSNLYQQVDRNKQAHADAITTETRTRVEEIRKLRELLETAAVGTPMVAYLGVFVVLLGSAVSTYAIELHGLLNQG